MEQLPTHMTVIGISKPGGPEVLVPETRALPVAGPGEILVRVAAAGHQRHHLVAELVAVGAGADRHHFT